MEIAPSRPQPYFIKGDTEKAKADHEKAKKLKRGK
jgi:hypothetical protein